MNNSDIKGSSKIDSLFQQITGSYYLIPNIKKCLEKLLEIINCERSLIASSIYYEPPNGNKIVINNYTHEDKKSFNVRIFSSSSFILI